ncbi:glycosyltransferase family 1 protein [Ktedonosporobacter rubrisoli]|uniref:Glycosyltransferase family 1 protein n=1 Tax=Ktedonosporobacter rubrisoli TaxID=2509675 RepID=A0A4V0YZA4_KTERU|nr:glycosyltransferase family 1 protein [Ktedonosporobacter rubrisoli]QBD79031.1 glycosyltransferase family 1 protein [Ktedonosporobacter rubrisoli]
MRIAIDYTAAIRQGAGIGTYVRNLVAAILAQDPENRYTLLTSGRPTGEHRFPQAENVRGRSILIPDRYLNVLWYRWHVPLPATLFAGATDIYHGPDFVLPPLGNTIRKVVTIHDLAFLEHPEYAVPSLAAYLRQVVPEAIEAADVVATVSHEVSKTLIRHFQTPPAKITVVPNGVGAHFRRISDPIILDATRYKFGLKHPLVLAVGTMEPRKNHIGLIKAFHKAQAHKNGPAMLAIAGGEGWLYDETRQVVADLKLEKKVRFLGRVSDLELITLYSMTDIFAFPSFFEGFGIPPLEAMACGAPVITSTTSSLPEVVGDAALLVDPHDIEALATSITRLLENAQLRSELQQKGYQRVKHFTWAASAQKMLTIYQKLYNGEKDFSDEVTTI